MSRARILSPLPMLTLALLAGCASAPKAGTPGPDAKLEAAYAEELAPATPEEIAEIERADPLTRANFWAAEFRKDPNFGFDVPVDVPGVPQLLLDPRRTWGNPDGYDEQADKLVKMFADNFEQYQPYIDDDVKAAAIG